MKICEINKEATDIVEREKLTVLLNEEDIRRMVEIAYSKDTVKQQRRLVYTSRNIFIFIVIAIFASLVIRNMNNPSLAVMLVIAGIFFSLIFLIAAAIGKKSAKGIKENHLKNELARRKDGFLPRTYTFEKDGIHTVGRYSDFVVSYDELHECHEYADGIFFRYESGQMLWLPARFFTKDLAEEVGNAMKYVFMKNYFLHEKLSAPDVPEAVAGEKLIEPQGESDFIIEYKTSKFSLLQRVVNSIKGKRMLIIILSVFLLVYVGVKFVEQFISFVTSGGASLNADNVIDLVCGFAFGFSFIFLIGVYLTTLLRVYYNIYKAGAGWVREGTRLELYENGFVEKIAAGSTFTPWDNLQTVLYSAGDLVLMDKAGRGIVIPESALREDREETENAIRKHLPQEHEHNHEHDKNCHCGCNHEHEHNHSEECDCEECEGNK